MKRRIFLFVVCLIGLITVTTLVINGRIEPFDNAIRYFFYDMRRPWLTAILIPVTYLGNWQILTAISLLLILLNPTRKKYGLPLGISAIFSDLVNKGIKYSVRRIRPEKGLHIIEQGGYSFPSGHAMTGFVFYGMLIYLLRRKFLCEYKSDGSPYGLLELAKRKRKVDIFTLLIAILIMLIGVSRIYVGVHFPSDVLAGWFLGAMVLTVSITIHEKIFGL